MSRSEENAEKSQGDFDQAFASLLGKIEAHPEPVKRVGELHTPGNFLHLVQDPATGEFLAPTYATLYGQITEAFERHSSAREMFDVAEANDSLMLGSFWPYPPVPFRICRSNKVALIDSGVLTQHPLLREAIIDTVDFTGEGIEDTFGHGTIQAIRQLWFEPYAKLIIIKAFYKDFKASLSTLAAAIEYLRKAEVGYIFMAGGINTLEYPQGELICQLADLLVEEKGLNAGGFVATTGNIGKKGQWCPADASSVWGVGVIDKDTSKHPFNTGGIAIAQKGDYASFPDITPMSLGQFYSDYSWWFHKGGHTQLARQFAERALDFESVHVQAVHLMGITSLQLGELEESVKYLKEAVEKYTSRTPPFGDLAVALWYSGRNDEAGEYFEKALSASPSDVVVRNNYAVFCENILKDLPRALEHYGSAAGLDPAYLVQVIEFGWRAFYDEHYDLSIKANQMLTALDPTFAAAYYNIAINHWLKGDADAAKENLALYEKNRHPLDSSRHRYNADLLVEILSGADAVTQTALLEYSLDDDRKYSRQYASLRDLLNAPREDARQESLNGLDESELSALAAGASSYAARLLLYESSDEHAELAHVLTLICHRMKRGGDNEVLATALTSLGHLYHRTGEFDRAIESFDEAVKLWEDLSVREKESALVDKGFAEIAKGDLKAAEESFQEAFRTSADLKQDSDGGRTFLTVKVPRICVGRAYLAFRGDDLKTAHEELERAFLGDQDNIETLLLIVGMALKESQKERMEQALGHAFRLAYRDELSTMRFLRLMEDHPIYNFAPRGGYSVLDYFSSFATAFLEAQVSLVSTTLFPLDSLYNAATDEYYFSEQCKGNGESAGDSGGVKQAIMGTGLLSKHPCLAGGITDEIDLTGEGPEDFNGSSTYQALQVLQSHDSVSKQTQATSPRPEMINVKVLNKEGRGSIVNLIHGLLWARQLGAKVILTNAQTSIMNRHLLGTVRRVSRSTVIVATAPDEGQGTAFPEAAAGNILIA